MMKNSDNEKYPKKKKHDTPYLWNSSSMKLTYQTNLLPSLAPEPLSVAA